MGFCSQRVGRGVGVDGKLLRGDIEGRGILAGLTQQNSYPRLTKDLDIKGGG